LRARATTFHAFPACEPAPPQSETHNPEISPFASRPHSTRRDLASRRRCCTDSPARRPHVARAQTVCPRRGIQGCNRNDSPSTTVLRDRSNDNPRNDQTRSPRRQKNTYRSPFAEPAKERTLQARE